MEITFATKCLVTAEKYIDESDWQALKDNKEKVLEAVGNETIRICDPFIYGSVKIASSKNWKGTEKEFEDYVYNKLLKGNK